MRGKSHISLGHYLLDRYLPDLPKCHRRAFLLGCIQPDRNPVTYLKGSVRHQWLRGHNYLNARRFMGKMAARLEKKEKLQLFDYYTLGKLIHYTADAFTFAHNESFSEKLSGHHAYEVRLQNYFLLYLQKNPKVEICSARTIMESIGIFHRMYCAESADIHRDSRFVLQACCSVLAILLSNRLI